ncbi:MAG: DUF1700 domain-containing protein [Firmicutes bacterium]|nr:DUF1700 domain-containing protein [Bacillota bacterium]
MNKEKYLAELSKKLRRLPRQEYMSAMAYYREYFEDAGPEMEEQVIKDLGTPSEVANEIIRNRAYKKVNEPVRSVKKGFSVLWMVILGIFAVPIAFPLALALLAILGSAVVVVCCVWLCGFFLAFAAIAGGIVLAVCGAMVTSAHPATGVANMGLGILIVGLGILVLLCALGAGKLLLFLLRKLFSWILGRRKS